MNKLNFDINLDIVSKLVEDALNSPSLRFQAHLQPAQSSPAIQRLQKSLQALLTLTHGHKDNAAKIKDRISKDKNGQLVTGGIFYCRDSAGFIVSATNKLLCNLTGQDRASKSATNHTAKPLMFIA